MLDQIINGDTSQRQANKQRLISSLPDCPYHLRSSSCSTTRFSYFVGLERPIYSRPCKFSLSEPLSHPSSLSSAMPALSHKRSIPRRRRRADDAEEEDSTIGDGPEGSISEGSVISNEEDVDDEGSENSENHSRPVVKVPISQSNDSRSIQVDAPASNGTSRYATNGHFVAGLDTQAMMVRVEQSPEDASSAAVDFDDAVQDLINVEKARSMTAQKPTRQEPYMEKSRRDHQEYLKEKSQNPAFVPNRGGFFLHDDRTSASSGQLRATGRGRARASYNGAQHGSDIPYQCVNAELTISRRPLQQPEATSQPWAHDLHETVTKDEQPSMNTDGPSSVTAALQQPVLRSVRTPPNRNFSISRHIGNTAVTVSLAGMEKSVQVPNVPKKQHTLLPQHRPPLRRDKPVRISIPDMLPRFIFPTTERSFIFIPRAMRPNQQPFARGRGRGSFHGSRRTSMFGGSVYTPSVAMSRRSSIGVNAHNGIHSPGGSLLLRGVGQMGEAGRPVVRLPPSIQPNMMPPTAAAYAPPLMPIQALQESAVTSLPMHQPRPQKTISMSEIESPTKFAFQPPPQQQGQPFHQQVPVEMQNQVFAQEGAHSRHPSQPNISTPMAAMQNSSIYAPPFQPYSMAPPNGIFAQYPGPVFYPTMAPEMSQYSAANPPTVMAPIFVPGAPYIMPSQPLGPDSTVENSMMAQEANGMVYYFEPTQMQGSGGMTFPPQYVGMGGMMTPPAQYYYPPQPGMFYAPQ